MATYVLIHTNPTDVPPSADREKLEEIAKHLNEGALNSHLPDRWIVIHKYIYHDLLHISKPKIHEQIRLPFEA